jgi:hypothetical protein
MASVTNQLPGIYSLQGLIPPARIMRFFRAAGRDAQRALELHDWNEAVGAAFYPLLQKVELALAVKVESAMAAVYGPEWFADPAFLRAADYATRIEIAATRRRLMAAERLVDANGMMDKASFGLWVGLLRPIFNPPVWMTRLSTAFPSLPRGVGRHDLAQLASAAAFLRNRIDHHEPLIRLDLSACLADIRTLLTWIDPALAARADGKGIQLLLREKP